MLSHKAGSWSKCQTFHCYGIVVGLITGLNTQEICEAFNDGFKDVLMGATVGLARSIAVVLEDGKIMDTIVHSLGSVLMAPHQR